MGIKVTVADITNVENSSGVPTINTNFDTVADEFDLVHYRDGSLAATGDWDMDSNRVLNLPQPETAGEPLRLGDLEDATSYFANLMQLTSYYAVVADGVNATAQPDTFISDETGRLTWYDADGGILGLPATTDELDIAVTSATASKNSATASAASATASAGAAATAQTGAENARDAAILADGLYDTTAAGIAATVNNDVFGIPSASTNGAIDLYENNAGVALNLNKTVPSLALVRSLNVTVNSAFETDISGTYPYVDKVITKVVLNNAKSHDYRVGLLRTNVNQFTVHIWDDTLGDQVAYIDVDPVAEYGSYAAMAAEKIPLIGLDPIGGDYSGVLGYVEIDNAEVVQGAAVYQPANFAEGGIRRTNVHTRFSVRDKHPGEAFQEVIVFGAGETYTTPQLAVESTYDEPLADPMGIAVLPNCIRASANHRILLLGMPGTYTCQNLHLPEWVSIGAEQRGAVILNHVPAATLPMIQGHTNHEAFDLIFRTTVAGEYAWHFDYVHNFQTPVDQEGDVNREFYVRFRRNRWIVGAGMNYQPFGSGIPKQATIEFDGDEFESESTVFTAPFAAAHNSDTLGGGRLIFNNCVDKSGRTDTSTVIVQTTYTNTNKSFLEINNCPTFNAVTSHQQVGGTTNAWKGVGNYEGTTYVNQATFPGEVLEFSSVATLLNNSGAAITAGKAVTRSGMAVSGLAQDGTPIDAIAFETTAHGALGRFFVARRIDERMLTISGATTPSWLYVTNGTLTTTAQASGIRVGHRSGGVVRLL